MIVEFMSDHNPCGEWHCIVTKNLTVVPQEGTIVRIIEKGYPSTKTIKLKELSLMLTFQNTLFIFHE